MKSHNRIIGLTIGVLISFYTNHLVALHQNIDIKNNFLNQVFASPVGAQQHDIIIYDAFARASISHRGTGVTYLKIDNKTHQTDYLISVRSKIAEKSELHAHIYEKGIMKMRQVKRIAIPPKKTVSLEPGKQHIMFKNLFQLLKAGEEFSLDLIFEKAGKVSITVQVGPVGAINSNHKSCNCSKSKQHR